MRKLLLLAALAAPPASAADAPPAAAAPAATVPAATTMAAAPDGLHGYVAEYDLLRNDKVEGRASIALAALDDGRWELRNATRGTKGLPGLIGFRIDERSLVRWHGDVPATLGYQYLQKTAFKNSERSLQVDAAGGHIVSRDGKKEYLLDYREDVMDRQAVTLALAHDIARGIDGVREYVVADRDAIDTQHYRIGENEHLVTAAGEFDTVRVERIRGSANPRKTSTWYAATAQPFMVRLLQTEPDGDRIEMRLTAYRPQ